MDIFNFFKKNKLLAAAILNFAVSAVVGGVFGYYGATQLATSNIPSAINGFIHAKAPVQVTTDEEAKTIAVVKKASPAVVSIVASKDLTIVEQQGGFSPFRDFCGDPFFRQFLGSQCNQQSQPPQTRTEHQQVAAGSGFIISSDGLILTNKHVVNVAGADYTVVTNDNKKYKAQVLARDPVQDLALVKIGALGLPTLTLGDSSRLQVGQTAIAIGNALGQFSNTVSRGVVSGLSRSIVANDQGSAERLSQVIQTDAAINPGNSGGPLLNLSGEVIGINTAIVQGAQNIGFAIPINQAKRDITQVRSLGKISYPFLGIRYVLINDDLQKQKNLAVNYGALVVRGDAASDVAVTPGSPADKAGLKEGDIILEVDGKRVEAANDLAAAIQEHSVGDTVRLKVLSRVQTKDLELKLEERK